jgi:hypothetical protein
MISASWPMPKLAKKEVSDFQNRKIIRASSTTNSYIPQIISYSPQIIKALILPGALYSSDDPMYSTYDPNGSIPFPKQKAFDPTVYLDIYNKLDTLISSKPTVKGRIHVTKEMLPAEVFTISPNASNKEVAKIFGIPYDYLASISIILDQKDPFDETSNMYIVEIERYLSNSDEPF